MATFALLTLELVKFQVGIFFIVFLLLEIESSLLCWVTGPAEPGLPLGDSLGVPQPTGHLLVHVVALDN